MYKQTKYIAGIIMILLFVFFSCKENSGSNSPALTDGRAVNWIKISDGLEKAESEKKPALIFFYTDWCIYCKKMNSEIFSDPEIYSYMNDNFISMRVNPEKDSDTIEIMGEKITSSKLMSYTGSNGFPTTLFFNSKKKPVTTIPGFLEKKTFLSILKYLKDECYESRISLDDYIKNPDVCKKR